MGNYLNPGSQAFQMILESEIFVDKSGLIAVTNRYARTMQRYMCVSRPRRFGKSTAADMLAAYYGRNEDTSVLFERLKIGQEQSYQKHLNKYDVIKINMQEFLSMSESVEDMLNILQMRLIKDLKSAYPEVVSSDRLMFAMQDVFAETKCQFVILIDEWDCLFREYKQDKEAQKKLSLIHI